MVRDSAQTVAEVNEDATDDQARGLRTYLNMTYSPLK